MTSVFFFLRERHHRETSRERPTTRITWAGKKEKNSFPFRAKFE